MTDFSEAEAAGRDQLLLGLLKTPPQPRPKRERRVNSASETSDISEEPEPSAEPS